MARVEWVKQRLENWARWIVMQESGGLGYPRQSAFVKMGGHGARAEAVIPIDSVEASTTNTAVEALRLGKGHLYQTIHCYYVRGIGISGTARHLHKAESTIKLHLEQADRALEIWFRERAERGKRVFTP